MIVKRGKKLEELLSNIQEYGYTLYLIDDSTKETHLITDIEIFAKSIPKYVNIYATKTI